MEREIKLHSELDHPHIIKLWDTLVDGDRIFMIMEYADLGNLFNHQNSKNCFTEAEAFKFFTQTLEGVRYLHQQNIIHRDLKVLIIGYSQRTCFWIRIRTSRSVTLGGVQRTSKLKGPPFAGRMSTWRRKCYSRPSMTIVWMCGRWGFCCMRCCMVSLRSKAKMRLMFKKQC